MTGGRSLARFVMVVTTGWLLAVPPAIGAVHSFASPYPSSADAVAFDAHVKKGQIVKVTGLGYSGFWFPCTPDPYSFFGSPFEAKVNGDREFRIDPYGTEQGDPKAVLLGKFNRKGTAARGSFTVKGNFSGYQCDGGHTWVSKRT